MVFLCPNTELTAIIACEFLAQNPDTEVAPVTLIRCPSTRRACSRSTLTRNINIRFVGQHLALALDIARRCGLRIIQALSSSNNREIARNRFDAVGRGYARPPG